MASLTIAAPGSVQTAAAAGADLRVSPNARAAVPLSPSSPGSPSSALYQLYIPTYGGLEHLADTPLFGAAESELDISANSPTNIVAMPVRSGVDVASHSLKIKETYGCCGRRPASRRALDTICAVAESVEQQGAWQLLLTFSSPPVCVDRTCGPYKPALWWHRQGALWFGGDSG
jgi:hypothetical protein